MVTDGSAGVQRMPAITARELYRQAREHAAAQGDYDVQRGLDRFTAWMEGEAQDQPQSRAESQWETPTWEDLVRGHSARVYRLAYRLTGNPRDAEDLTHDAFVRVYRSLNSYPPGTAEAWLHRVTVTLFHEGARRRRLALEGYREDDARPAGSEPPTPSEALANLDVQAALMSLPPDYRSAVVLCDIEGYSMEEIAATLGIRMGTARSRVHRGRAMLRSLLASPEGFPITDPPSG